MLELVDVTWTREIRLDLNLNKEMMKGNDADDQPTPIVKLPRAQVCLITIKSKHPSEFSIVVTYNMQSFLDKLNKMSSSNINKHHPETTNSYFRSV